MKKLRLVHDKIKFVISDNEDEYGTIIVDYYEENDTEEEYLIDTSIKKGSFELIKKKSIHPNLLKEWKKQIGEKI